MTVFFLRFGLSAQFIFNSVFVALLLVATITDFQVRVIPDEVSFYGILFEKTKTKEARAKELKIQKSELEELEEAIKGLDLFKKIDKETLNVKEMPKEETIEKKKTSIEEIQEQESAKIKESIFQRLLSKIKKKEEPEGLKGREDKKLLKR